MNKLLVTAILTLTGALFAQDNYMQWSSYKDISFNTGASGANVPGNLTGFPVLIRLTSANADIFTQTLPGGADIRFSKANGVHLPYQIERWDALNQVAEIWVLADTVFGNSTAQSVRMWWGKTGAVDSSNGSAVFSNGYVSVWHLGDASGTSPRPNAVTGGFSATPVNFPGNYVVPSGIIGMADSLIGGPGRTSSLPVPYLKVDSGTATTSFNFPNGTMSYSVWIYPVRATANARMLEMTGVLATGNDRIWMGWNGTAATPSWRYNTGTAGSQQNSPTNTVSMNQWHYFTGVIGRNGASDTTRFYLDGAAIGTVLSTTTQLPNTARTFVFLGRSFEADGDSALAAKLDEPQISNVTRSPDWIRLSYQNQQATQTFLTLGASHANVTAPAIVTNPASQSATVGSTVKFVVVVSGTAPSFKWVHIHGATTDTISGATTDTLTLTNVATADTGSYKAIASNSQGTVASTAATLTLTAGPAITTQPVNVTVNLGAAAKFFIVATGAPLTYQWVHVHGSAIDTLSGATSDTLKIPAVALADTGAYRVVVRNGAGQAISLTATLTVLVLPAITTNPANQSVTVGTAAKFFVVATGTAPLTYKWIHIHGGVTDTISSATSDTLKIATVAFADTGTYKAVVRNAAGQAISTTATLTVAPVSIFHAGRTDNSQLIRMSGSSILFRLPDGNLGARAVVMDVWGRVVWSKAIGAGVREMLWDRGMSSGVVPGIYIARLTVLDSGHKSFLAAESKVFVTP